MKDNRYVEHCLFQTHKFKIIGISFLQSVVVFCKKFDATLHHQLSTHDWRGEVPTNGPNNEEQAKPWVDNANLTRQVEHFETKVKEKEEVAAKAAQVTSRKHSHLSIPQTRTGISLQVVEKTETVLDYQPMAWAIPNIQRWKEKSCWYLAC